MKRTGGFTLLELMVVVVILSILATMGASQYNAAKEKALDNEAKVNLRLILAAERVYRMEDNRSPPEYVNCANIPAVNANLRLALSNTNPNWNYLVKSAGVAGFCADAQRTNGIPPLRAWRIIVPPTDTEPVVGACP